MYYHVRLDRIFHDGRTDMDAQAEWDFRSLTKALAMIGRDYGMDAAGWRIQDLTEPMSNIMLLENHMRVALESSHQFVVMTFKDASPALKKYDHYEFFVVAREEAERPPEFAFSKEDEEAIVVPEVAFEPNVRSSLIDILRSFDVAMRFDFVGKAFAAILEFYCGDERDVPNDVWQLRDKEQLKPEDYVMLADECLSCGDEQLAARLYVSGYCADGEAKEKGRALVKLADLYMNSDWPKNGGRDWDLMKAVDLLTEALTLGCVASAKDALEGMRERLFEDYEDEPDMDYFIRNYQPDTLCLAAFCLGVGIGWKKDVVSSRRLYEAALAQGYPRASYYLKEIDSGHV